jgi:hypothetical protein
MACNATRIELSNSAVTTLTVTLTTDPGDGTTVLLIVGGLSITTSGTTSGGSATLTPVAAVVADTNSLWDAVIQVGTNRPAVAEVLVTETNTSQNLGITITDSQVTYCAPVSGGGGGGDAVTAGNLSQFADVSYPATIREADVLARSLATGWTTTRPEALWVDRRPMIFEFYGSNNDSANWGVSLSQFRLTPTSGSADLTDTTNNGRLAWVISRFMTPQSGNTEKIERYLIGTPSGYIQENADRYPSSAGWIIENDPASLFSYNSDGTTLTAYPTPFTTDGTTSGTIGSQSESWLAAISYLKADADFVDQNLEVGAYIGYYIAHDSNGDPINAINGTDQDFTWVDKPTLAEIQTYFDAQWGYLDTAGFDYFGLDASREVWWDAGSEGRVFIDAFQDIATDRVLYEAIPRDMATGEQLDRSRSYTNARYLALFPTLAEIDGVTISSPAASRLRVDDWNLDPNNTECHLLFEWKRLAGTDFNLTGARIRELMDMAHERGFVVSPAAVSFPPDTTDGWTVQEFIQYAIDLYKKSRGLFVPGTVYSVNGEVGAVVLTGDEIDTTAASGVSVTTELNGKADAATLTDLGGNVSGTISTSLNAFSLNAALDLNDLGDVNVAQGAGNDGDLITYDHAAGAGAKFKGVARSAIGLSEFDNDLPAVQDSYLMLIESPTDKTYIIDGRVAAGRTVTNFYAKTSSGTCTATLRNASDTPPSLIGSISVTSTGGSAATLANTSVTENERLSIEISSNSSSADLELVVEYTQ